MSSNHEWLPHKVVKVRTVIICPILPLTSQTPLNSLFMLIESHITHDRVYSIRPLLIRPYLQWGSDYMAQKDFMTKNNKNRYNGHVAKNNKVGKEVSNEERRVTRRVCRPCAVIRARGRTPRAAPTAPHGPGTSAEHRTPFT